MRPIHRSVVLTIILSLLVCGQALALTGVGNFGANPGNLEMYRHVPPDMPPNASLVVVLHGCTQSASSYDQDTGWSDLADQGKFYVVYAQQKSANNYNKCFNWFEPGDFRRGSGEAQSIASMVSRMKADYSIDPDGVFVTGVSAGGAMTAVMMGSYPDVFAGGAVMAGIPYGCADDVWDGLSCMSGVDKTPVQWGNAVRNGFPGYGGPYPVLTLFHGTADSKVDIVNAGELMEQWTEVHGSDRIPEVDETFRGHDHLVYHNTEDLPVVEVYRIRDMDHGIAIDPGSEADQGGQTGEYAFDEGIWSSFYAARFWGIVDGGSAEAFVDIASPTPGSVVSGSVTITANAEGIDTSRGVEFFVNGVSMGVDASAPYEFGWDTTAVADGGYALKAVAYRGDNGDLLVDDDTNITVSNATPACQDWYTSNYTHVMEGRAFALFGLVYAKGSSQYMGLFNIFSYNWLKEVSADYYVIDSCQ